jgi:ribonuclease BN (tRNA processing enzyme)
MRLTVVGCAGSFPGPESPASCYLLEADGFRLVIDLGNGALGGLQKYAGLSGIDAICLSHLHADHCVDLYSYRVAREIVPGGPLPPIPVYGPSGTAERIALVHGPGGDDGMTERFTFETLAPGTFEIGPFRIAADHMNHPVETFGFRVDQGGMRLAYSADTGQSEALVRLAEGADVLLCEASFLDAPDLPAGVHLTGRQAGEHAARAGVRELVLTHLVTWNDTAASLAEATAAFDGPVSLAAAGRVIDPASQPGR